MTTSRFFEMPTSSNPVHLTREAAKALSSLKRRLEQYQKRGYSDLAHKATLEMLEITNDSTLQSLESGDFDPDDVLMFCELPEHFFEPARADAARKKVHLNLLLNANSSLAREIEAVLKKHMEGE